MTHTPCCFPFFTLALFFVCKFTEIITVVNERYSITPIMHNECDIAENIKGMNMINVSLFFLCETHQVGDDCSIELTV